MKTITININERTKAGKAFLAMLEAFLKGKKGVEIIEEEKSTEEIVEELSKEVKKSIHQKYVLPILNK